MDVDFSFGKLVKQHRKALTLTQAELARRVGCATVTLRKIEYDALRPSVQIAERLAMAVDLPLEERADFVRLARAAGVETPTPPLPEEIGEEDLSGRAVRGYELGERIGSGGFGAVYRATQLVLEREVAIKIILPQYANHPDFIRRIIIKNEEGRTLIDIPLTSGVVVALVAPQLAAIGAIAALVSRGTIIVEKLEDQL